MVVLFKYVDNGEPWRGWLMSVLQGFANLVTLPDNWDSEGASKIDRTTINALWLPSNDYSHVTDRRRALCRSRTQGFKSSGTATIGIWRLSSIQAGE